MKCDRRRPSLLPRAVVLLALAVAGTVWMVQVHQQRPSRQSIPATPLAVNQTPITNKNGDTSSDDSAADMEPRADESLYAEAHPLALALGTPAIPPEKEPDTVLNMLQGYRDLFGAYPTAEDNPSLVAKITQPRGGIRLIPATHPRISAGGALLDAWGTPFFFHFLSHRAIEVRSAGPDRELFTEDDIVAADPFAADAIP